MFSQVLRFPIKLFECMFRPYLTNGKPSQGGSFQALDHKPNTAEWMDRDDAHTHMET